MKIDHSEWEPCNKCRSCFACAHVVENINDSRNACFWCDHKDKFKPMNFCPKCGRPLTDAAWKMLEQRLQGWKQVEHKGYPPVEYNYTGIDDEKQRQAQEAAERLLERVRNGEAHGGEVNDTTID